LAAIVCVGELIVEIMRKQVGVALDRPDDFAGPFPSGAPAIFIDAAAGLGADAAMVAAVGDDDFGKCCLDRLRADGVDTSGVKIASRYTTGTAFVTYFDDGSRQFIFHLPHSAAAQVSPDDVDESVMNGVKWFHVCGSSLSVGQGMRDACYKAAEIAHSRGAMVSLDPNLRPELLGIDEVRRICGPILEIADVIFPSGDEAAMLADIDSPEDACRQLVKSGARVVALKRGADGCTVFSAHGEVNVQGILAEVVDPTGAGDCFDAGFAIGMLRGLSLPDAAALANKAGAHAVTVRGPMAGAPDD